MGKLWRKIVAFFTSDPVAEKRKKYNRADSVAEFEYDPKFSRLQNREGDHRLRATRSLLDIVQENNEYSVYREYQSERDRRRESRLYQHR